MHTANWTWRGGPGACMKPSHPSSEFFGGWRYSAGYLKRNLQTNPATKYLITICPAWRRGAYIFRATENTTGNTFCSLVLFWSGRGPIQALSSADISIRDMKYENGQIPWSCSLLRRTCSSCYLWAPWGFTLILICSFFNGIFHPLCKSNYASDSRNVLIFIRTKLMYSEFMGKMGDKKILNPGNDHLKAQFGHLSNPMRSIASTLFPRGNECQW